MGFKCPSCHTDFVEQEDWIEHILNDNCPGAIQEILKNLSEASKGCYLPQTIFYLENNQGDINDTGKRRELSNGAM